ncbi:MAG: hypothetical protein HYX63_21550 [Gammaproteobacteria bacterium]|nr:hypothetical protein [Gammaproteobacteria bacterium]
MSLINQMLHDLEVRRGGALTAVDRALDGLQTGGSIGARAPDAQRRVLTALLVAAAVAGAWLSRPPLTALLKTHALEPPSALAIEKRPAAELPSLPRLPLVSRRVAENPTVVVAAPAAVQPSAPKPATNAVVNSRTAAVTAELRATAAAIEHDTTPAIAAREPRVAAPPAATDSPVIERAGTFHRERALPAAPTVGELEYQRAVNLLAAGADARGLAALKTYVVGHPQVPAARERYAEELIKLNQVDAAEQVLREGLNLIPDRASYARLLAHLLFDRNDLASALAVLRGATPPLRADPEYYAFMAALYQRGGNHRAAVNVYEQILKVEPENGANWIGAAISLLALKENAAAVIAFRHAAGDERLSKPMRDYAEHELTRIGVEQ